MGFASLCDMLTESRFSCTFVVQGWIHCSYTATTLKENVMFWCQITQNNFVEYV